MKRYLRCVLSVALVISTLTLHTSQGADVRPPLFPHISEETDSIEEAERLPPVSQPSRLKGNLLDLQKGSIQDRVKKLKQKILADLVYVSGGTYMMGDFGEFVTKSHLPLTPMTNNKPPHKVTLSSFSISRYKTVFAEYDVFLDATNRPRVDDPVVPYRSSLVPANALWQQAKDYCQWVGKITGLPFDFPTEAQWEYAARSRGQNFVFATNDGNLEFGRNVDDSNQRKLIAPMSDNADKWGNHQKLDYYPVGMFPSNPLGLLI